MTTTNDLRNDPEYRRHYNRGWQSSSRGGSLDAADSRHEPDAWYDGYLDLAAGREKWHYATCQDRDHHQRCDGGPVDPGFGPNVGRETRRAERVIYWEARRAGLAPQAARLALVMRRREWSR